GSGVAVITVSHSGSTVETVLATRLAKEAGAKIIGITRPRQTPLQRPRHVGRPTHPKEDRHRPQALSNPPAQRGAAHPPGSCRPSADPKGSVSKLQLSAQVIAEKRY